MNIPAEAAAAMMAVGTVEREGLPEWALDLGCEAYIETGGHAIKCLVLLQSLGMDMAHSVVAVRRAREYFA